ncbi:MAG: P1 family peptidase [Planctomycetota bacterium]
MSVQPGPKDLLTDVAGLSVGHAVDETIRTGTTVVLPDAPVVMAADVRGGGPGTRETDLLDPSRPIAEFHGAVLSGGSVFGLDAASGVVDRLSARGIGLDRGPRRLPLVPAAILFDLRNGGDKDWGDVSPYRRLGIEACEAAAVDFAVGRVGAGFGATAGDVPGGIGSASATTGEWTVAALVAVNSFGVVTTPPDGLAPVPMPKLALPGENTTLVVVATDLALTKAEAKRVAMMAHDGMARTIRPIHTPFDGDTVFVMSTGRVSPGADPSITLVAAGTLAADCVASSIRRAIR